VVIERETMGRVSKSWASIGGGRNRGALSGFTEFGVRAKWGEF